MKQYLINSIAFIISFLLGLSGISIWNSANSFINSLITAQIEPINTEYHKPIFCGLVERNNKDCNTKITFEGKLEGCGPGISFTGYRSSDGIEVSKSRRYFESAADAKVHFEFRMKSVIRIIEQNPNYDKNGNRIGDKITVIMKAAQNNKQIATIIWIDKNSVMSIESSSLHHAKLFEQFEQSER